jgi:hypothetical protein
MKKLPSVRSTPFSDFFRSASSDKKQRVYTAVLARATERQLKILKAS